MIAGMSACLGVGDRQPDDLLELVGRPAVGQRDRDVVAPAGEEARVEAAHAAGRRDGARDEAQAFERRLHAVFGKALPVGLGGGERALAADQQAGLLIGLADRRQRDRAGARRASGGCCRGRALPLRRGCRPSATATRLSAGSVRPPGKTNLPGMKACRAWRRPISTLDLAAAAVEQDQRRGVARAQRPCRRAAHRPVGFGLVMPSMRPSSGRLHAPLPCARSASGFGMRLELVVLAAEAVHVERPLQADDRALDRAAAGRAPRRRSAAPRSRDAARSTACWSPRRP